MNNLIGKNLGAFFLLGALGNCISCSTVQPAPDGKGISGVGAIVRNDGGKVVVALCKALPSCYPAEWAELFALEQGVLLAQQLAISNVIFESDVVPVIQAISQDLCGGVATI